MKTLKEIERILSLDIKYQDAVQGIAYLLAEDKKTAAGTVIWTIDPDEYHISFKPYRKNKEVISNDIKRVRKIFFNDTDNVEQFNGIIDKNIVHYAETR